MGCLFFLGALMLAIVSWIIWGLLICIVFLLAAGIPWAIWEFFMYLTFNNVINAASKLPTFFGALLGFVLTLPFAGIAGGIALWAYIQTAFMGLLTFRGFHDHFAETFIKNIVEPLESEGCHHFVIARFYYEHCQWLWGGGSFMYSYYPWQNNCGEGWSKGDFFWPICDMEFPFICIKLVFLALPYVAMFVLPLLPIVWSISRPFVGAMSRLPSISRNGEGRD